MMMQNINGIIIRANIYIPGGGTKTWEDAKHVTPLQIHDSDPSLIGMWDISSGEAQRSRLKVLYELCC